MAVHGVRSGDRARPHDDPPAVPPLDAAITSAAGNWFRAVTIVGAGDSRVSMRATESGATCIAAAPATQGFARFSM